MIKQKARTTMKTINGDCLTPILIFNRLQGERKFLLESSAKQDTIGRYSFIGANPRKTYNGANTTLYEHSHLTNKSYSYEGDLVHLMKQVMPRISSDTQFPFTGGAIGYIRFNRNEANIPAIHFHVYDTIIIFDHVRDDITIIHTNIDAEQVTSDLDTIIEQIIAPQQQHAQSYKQVKFEEQTDKEQFIAQGQQIQQAIQNGDVTQVVLARKLQASFEGDAFTFYRDLRVQNPSPYMYYIEFDDHIVIGASETSGINVYDGLLQSSIQTNADALLVKDSILRSTDKISGTLAPTLHAIDALTHLLPADRVTGTPKERAEAIIRAVEQQERSLYGGAIGYIGFNGQIDFTLATNTTLTQQGIATTERGVTITATTNLDSAYEQEG